MEFKSKISRKFWGYMFVFVAFFGVVMGAYYFQARDSNVYFYTPFTHRTKFFWKTYTNNVFGLSMKYPHDWRTLTDDDSLVSFLFRTNKQSATYLEAGDIATKIKALDLGNADFKKWFDKSYKAKNSASISKAKVADAELDGKVSIEQSYVVAKSGQQPALFVKEVYVMLNTDKVLLFTYTSPMPEGEQFELAFSKILTSVKFAK